MARQIGTYKTRNGKGEYTFGFRQEGGKVEVDIEATPSLKGRDSGGHSTHRLPSPHSATGTKICVAQPETVRTMEQAKRFAQGWAESMQDYIDKGTRF